MSETTEAPTSAADPIVARYEADLRSGRVFEMAAISHRSVRGYRPVTHSQEWRNLITAMASFTISDEHAQLAHAVLRDVPLYTSYHEMLAKAYDNAASAVEKGYTDVVRLASPEPGRRSDNERPYHLGVLVQLAYALRHADVRDPNNGGWCLEALRSREDVRVLTVSNAPRY